MFIITIQIHRNSNKGIDLNILAKTTVGLMGTTG